MVVIGIGLGFSDRHLSRANACMHTLQFLAQALFLLWWALLSLNIRGDNKAVVATTGFGFDQPMVIF